MSAPVLRSHWFRVGVLSVAAALGWQMLVSPVLEDLRIRQAEARGLVDTIAERQAAIDALPMPPQAAISKATEALETYRAFWAESSDTAGLYDHLTAVAGETGVQIERIEPRRIGNSRAPARDLIIGFEPTGYRIDLLGDLETIAHFTGAVQRDTGLTVVESVRIVPSGASQPGMTLRASMRTTHFRVFGEIVEPVDTVQGQGGAG
ncbi:MAG: hypothetical protein AAFP26_06615 [Planctomycetota bacterium]